MSCGRIWPSSALRLQGVEGLKELLTIIASDKDERLPADAHASLVVLAAELQAVQTLIGSIVAVELIDLHASSSTRSTGRCRAMGSPSTTPPSPQH